MYESLPAVVDNKLIQSTKEAKIALEGQIADLSRAGVVMLANAGK